MNNESQQLPTVQGEVVHERKSIFVNENETVPVDLGDGNIVNIKAKYSAGFVEDLGMTNEEDRKKVSIFLSKCIKSWNLLDEHGAIAPVTIEHIRNLPVPYMMQITKAIGDVINKQVELPKVVSPQSNDQ